MQKFDLTKLQVGHYITLACGLGFTVDMIVPHPEVIALQISRYDRNKDVRIKKTITTTKKGFYLANEAPTMYDVVRVSDLDRTPHMTEAGAYIYGLKIDIVEFLKVKKYLHIKVRTRNNFWFNCQVVSVDQKTNMVVFKMESLTGDNSQPRINSYHTNGLSQQTVESQGSYYNPFDIIEIKTL